MFIMDSHAHVGKFHDRVATNNATWDTFEHARQLIESMDAYGIDVAAVSSYVGIQYNMHQGNEELGRIVQQSGGRIVGYATVHPGLEDEAVEALYTAVREHGLQGLKLHPDRQWIDVMMPMMHPVMEACADLDIPVLFHSLAATPSCTPEKIVQLARLHPRVNVIIGHMGLEPQASAGVAKDQPNVFLETSAVIPRLGELASAIRYIGADRVLMGTDFPGHHQEVELRKVELLDISEDELAKVMGLNAKALFKLPDDVARGPELARGAF